MANHKFLDVPTQANYQALLVQALRDRIPGWTPDVTDPGVYWADDTSARIIEWLNQFNASAEANDILLATGDALTRLVRQFGIIERLPGESDAALRLRFQRRWDSITAGTPAWDIVRAFESDSRVADAARSLVDWGANTVNIYVLDSSANNFPSDDRLNIQNALNREDKPTFWLDYRVPEVTQRFYLVSGYIVFDNRLADPIETVRSNMDSTLASLRTLDTGIDDSALIDGSWATGVERMELTVTSATMVAGQLLPGTPVTMPGSPDTVYIGHRNVQVAFPRSLPMRAAWGATADTLPTLSSLGSVGSTTVPSSTNRYLWIQVQDEGISQYSAFTLATSDGTIIPITRFNRNTFVSSISTLNSNSIDITFVATRRWPDITSRTEWGN